MGQRGPAALVLCRRGDRSGAGRLGLFGVRDRRPGRGACAAHAAQSHDRAGAAGPARRYGGRLGGGADGLGGAAANRRDPFAWQRADGTWALLLAQPGDWGTADGRGELELWTASDARDWRLAGRIGPFTPPGVLWEVPLMIEHGCGSATLIVSTVDRRANGSDCAVRAWNGVFDGAGFTPDE